MLPSLGSQLQGTLPTIRLGMDVRTLGQQLLQLISSAPRSGSSKQVSAGFSHGYVLEPNLAPWGKKWPRLLASTEHLTRPAVGEMTPVTFMKFVSFESASLLGCGQERAESKERERERAQNENLSNDRQVMHDNRTVKGPTSVSIICV